MSVTYFARTFSRFAQFFLTGDWPLSVWLLSDVSYSDECRTKKYFQYAENMFPLFSAILKFCSTKHLFNNLFYCYW